MLLFTAVSAFTLSVLDVGIEWINDAQILSQGLTILVLVNEHTNRSVDISLSLKFIDFRHWIAPY